MRYWAVIIGILFASLLFSFYSKDQGELTPYVFDKPIGFPPMPQSALNPVSVEGVEIGRYLFYDPILSRDSSVSCSSCHQQEFAFGGNQSFSIGVDGKETTRNAPPLFNLAWSPAFFWDGRASSIEEQVFVPVRDHAEMNLAWKEAEKRINRSDFYRPMFLKVFGKTFIDSVQIAYAIAQFERTLVSANSKLDQVLRRETKLTYLEYRGYEIVNDQSMGNCLHCHPTDALLLGSTYKFSNNGIENINDIAQYKDKGLGGITGLRKDIGRFKIPSLRNVAVSAPYMHDGRFSSLDEVVEFYSSGVNSSPNIDSKMAHVTQGGMQLSKEDQKAVVAFLECLTDSSYLTNEAFSNPFK